MSHPVAIEPNRNAALSAAVGLSVLLHVVALATAAWLVALPPEMPEEIIRIALIGGGGGGSHGDGAATTAPPAIAPEPIQPPPAPAAPIAIAPAIPQPQPKPQPRPRPARAPVKAPASVAAPDAPVAVAAVPQSTGSGEGTGIGNGEGSGTGPGSGSGSGGGSGSGHGTGHGAGSGSGDLRALCLSCPEPQYPRIARQRGWEGVVDVDVAIAVDGSVADAAVARSSGYVALDDAALEVARRSRFQLAGTAGAVHGRIAYGFRLTAR